MMKLAIIFLPVLFAVIWAAFIGLRITKVETRDGKRKLINYKSTTPDYSYYTTREVGE